MSVRATDPPGDQRSERRGVTRNDRQGVNTQLRKNIRTPIWESQLTHPELSAWDAELKKLKGTLIEMSALRSKRGGAKGDTHQDVHTRRRSSGSWRYRMARRTNDGSPSRRKPEHPRAAETTATWQPPECAAPAEVVSRSEDPTEPQSPARLDVPFVSTLGVPFVRPLYRFGPCPLDRLAIWQIGSSSPRFLV